MEKLNIRLITVVLASALVAISSSVHAGSDFRLSSKAPIHKQPEQFKGYVYGYGGIDFGGDYETTGIFDCGCGGEIPMDFELDNGWTGGGGIGACSGLLGGSRFEVEGSFTSNNVAGGLLYTGFILPAHFEMKTKAAMFNMLKEIPLGSATAYVGGGVGYASTSMKGDVATINYNDSDAGFAWQLIMGIDIPITERLALFTQYRYMVLSDMAFTTDFGDFTYTTDKNPASHAVVFGARLSF